MSNCQLYKKTAGDGKYFEFYYRFQPCTQPASNSECTYTIQCIRCKKYVSDLCFQPPIQDDVMKNISATFVCDDCCQELTQKAEKVIQLKNWAPEILKGKFVVIRGIDSKKSLLPSTASQSESNSQSAANFNATYRSSEILHVLSNSRVYCKGNSIIELINSCNGPDQAMCQKVNFPMSLRPLFNDGFMRNWRQILLNKSDEQIKPVPFQFPKIVEKSIAAIASQDSTLSNSSMNVNQKDTESGLGSGSQLFLGRMRASVTSVFSQLISASSRLSFVSSAPEMMQSQQDDETHFKLIESQQEDCHVEENFIVDNQESESIGDPKNLENSMNDQTATNSTDIVKEKKNMFGTSDANTPAENEQNLCQNLQQNLGTADNTHQETQTKISWESEHDTATKKRKRKSEIEKSDDAINASEKQNCVSPAKKKIKSSTQEKTIESDKESIKNSDANMNTAFSTCDDVQHDAVDMSEKYHDNYSKTQQMNKKQSETSQSIQQQSFSDNDIIATDGLPEIPQLFSESLHKPDIHVASHECYLTCCRLTQEEKAKIPTSFVTISSDYPYVQKNKANESRQYIEYINVSRLERYVAQGTDPCLRKAQQLLETARKKNGWLAMRYYRPGVTGRRFGSTMNACLQSVTKECRGAACGMEVLEIDFHHIYQSLVVQLCEFDLYRDHLLNLLGIKQENDDDNLLPMMRHFSDAQSKELILDRVLAHYSVDTNMPNGAAGPTTNTICRSDVEALFQHIFYGGTFQQWYEQTIASGRAISSKKALSYVGKFQKESHAAIAAFSAGNPELFEVFKQKKKALGEKVSQHGLNCMVFAYVIGELEDAVLTILEDTLVQNGHKICCLCFDSLLVYADGSLSTSKRRGSTPASNNETSLEKKTKQKKSITQSIIDSVLDAELNIDELIGYTVTFNIRCLNGRPVESGYHDAFAITAAQSKKRPTLDPNVILHSRKVDLKFAELVQRNYATDLAAARREREIEQKWREKLDELERAKQIIEEERDIALKENEEMKTRIQIMTSQNGNNSAKFAAVGSKNYPGQGSKDDDKKSKATRTPRAPKNPNNWTRKEITCFNKAMNDLDPTSASFWSEVQKSVETKTIEQCQQRHADLQQKGTNRKKTIKNKNDSQNKPIVIPKADGPRKMQAVREMLQQAELADSKRQADKYDLFHALSAESGNDGTQNSQEDLFNAPGVGDALMNLDLGMKVHMEKFNNISKDSSLDSINDFDDDINDHAYGSGGNCDLYSQPKPIGCDNFMFQHLKKARQQEKIDSREQLKREKEQNQNQLLLLQQQQKNGLGYTAQISRMFAKKDAEDEAEKYDGDDYWQFSNNGL